MLTPCCCNPRPESEPPPLFVRAAICGLYEKELKTLNPQIRDITYDIADLYTYLDQLHDLSCLV